MLKKLITLAGLAGTLGVAAPAFADWYQPAPGPVYGMPMQQPGYVDADDYWRHRGEWRRHEEWERHRRWRRWEWMRHHRYQNW